MNAVLTSVAACLPDQSWLSEDGEQITVPTNSFWFDPAKQLGPRGFRHLPLPAQLTVAAVRSLALTADQDGADIPEAATHGFWLGSSTAAAHCLAMLDDQILAEGAAGIGPMSAPFFSVNLVPARAVTEQGLTGPVVTLTSSGTAGFDALICAARAVSLGHVETATVVAVEVPAPVRGSARQYAHECGAVAFRLVSHGGGDDADGGARLSWAATCVSRKPAAAEHRVRKSLAASGALAPATSGPLHRMLQLASASRAQRDTTISISDPQGTAAGVALHQLGRDT